MKRIVKLTESDLSRIVKKVIKESDRENNMYYDGGEEMFIHDMMKIKLGLSDLQKTIRQDDKETSLFILDRILEKIHKMEK
jgi:hypothetical protein